MSFLGTQVKETMDITDEVIAQNMLSSAGASAQAYLTAALTCPTPELRTMLESSLEQVFSGHSQMVELAVQKGWEQPYDHPRKQLADAFEKSKFILGNNDND